MSKARHPQITIAQETVDHLEALVEGASARMPALAERLLEELSRARILPAARMPADVVQLQRGKRLALIPGGFRGCRHGCGCPGGKAACGQVHRSRHRHDQRRTGTL